MVHAPWPLVGPSRLLKKSAALAEEASRFGNRLNRDSVARRRIRVSGTAVKMRTDYSARELRWLTKASTDANQSRWLLSLAAVRDGMSRAEAAKIGRMDPQTLRD